MFGNLENIQKFLVFSVFLALSYNSRHFVDSAPPCPYNKSVFFVRRPVDSESEAAVMLLESARIQIAAYGRKMQSSGLCKGTSGNLSIFDPASGLMAISPSGMDYFQTEPADIVVLDLDGRTVDGSRRPSSEHAMHAAFYRRKPGLRAVVHTHSIFCTTLACMGLPLEAMHLVFAGAGCDRVPCAPYATFGTPELSCWPTTALSPAARAFPQPSLSRKIWNTPPSCNGAACAPARRIRSATTSSSSSASAFKPMARRTPPCNWPYKISKI